MASLQGKVCLVTGASRGIGKGIALQLGEAGATVYITGRTLKPKEGTSGKGCLQETADEVQSRGGVCIPVQCDHSKDEEVEKLFDKIKQEQSGQLDVLVNNAYSAVHAIGSGMGKKFWELPTTMWDDVNNVGLRNHYICAVYAARMMVERKQGLIINVSSGGGLRYLFNVAYGVGKEACDRMAADCAIELRKEKVACVSLWPGAVRTENVEDMLKSEEGQKQPQVQSLFKNGETPEYAGISVVHLAKDPNVMKKSGRILICSDLGDEYGFTDINGKHPYNLRSIKGMCAFRGYTGLAGWVPGWIKLPGWMLSLAGNKF